MQEQNFFNNITNRIKEHHIESFASQIAFYMLLSIFPFLILLFMLMTSLSIDSVDQMIYVYNVIPEQAGDIIKDYLEYSKQFSNSPFSPLLVLSIWMSSNAIIAMMKAVNVAYNLEETRNYLVRKFLAILCTLMTILLIVIAIVIPNVGLLAMDYVRKYLNVPEVNLHIFNFIRNVISLGMAFCILGSLYIILPNKKVTIKEVVPGTIFAFVGIGLISYLFSYFVRSFARYSLVYGSLAAVIILMIWLFLCGLILMLGGEINAIKYEKIQKS